MAKDKKIGIYKINNTINNKVYIGQSQDIDTRLRGHKSTLKANTHFNIHLQRAYNKYGIDSFTYETQEECSEDIINERESYWIEFYNSMDRFYGYNIDFGGNKAVMSDEHKLNMSLRRKGTYEIDVIDVNITYLEIQEVLKLKSKNEKLLLYSMLIYSKRYSDDNGIFYMTYKQMMKSTGLTKMTSIKLVNQLIEYEIINIISRNMSLTNSYKINLNINNVIYSNDVFIVGKYENNFIESFSKCLLKYFKRKDIKEICGERHYYKILKYV